MTVDMAPAREEDAKDIHELFNLVGAERIHILRMESPGLEAIQDGIERCLGGGGVYMPSAGAP